MTKTLKPAPVSTRQLTWDPQTREYVGEISSTHGFGRVYDDACDEGLTLVSGRTGNEEVFVVIDEVRDAEGDTQYWVLRPVNPNLDAALRLFND